MEHIKRKIFLEDSVDRTANSPTWGVMTATSFYMKVMVSQTIDDMGMFSDTPYIELGNPIGTPPNYNALTTKLSLSGYSFPFMYNIVPQPLTGITGTTKIVLRLPSNVKSSYYNYGNNTITGSTDSKIDDLKSYNLAIPYKIGFNMATETYTDYNNIVVSGVSRVSSNGEPKTYVLDAPNDINLGTVNQIYGLQYQDYTGQTRQVTINGVTNTIPLTNFRFIGQGINETNVSLSAITKEEYLFGIISRPTVESDVYIDRGTNSIMDMHLRLSEIKDLGELSRYGNGYYNLNKQ